MNRRAFARNLCKLLAGAAAAPLAGPVILKALTPTPKPLVGFWYQSSRLSGCYSKEYIELLTDRVTAEEFKRSMVRYYERHTDT